MQKIDEKDEKYQVKYLIDAFKENQKVKIDFDGQNKYLNTMSNLSKDQAKKEQISLDMNQNYKKNIIKLCKFIELILI